MQQDFPKSRLLQTTRGEKAGDDTLNTHYVYGSINDRVPVLEFPKPTATNNYLTPWSRADRFSASQEISRML